TLYNMIIQSGHVVQFTAGGFKTLEKLPKKVMLLQFNEKKNEFYLEIQKEFTLPAKIYGNVQELSKRYLNTFKKGNKNLGILLKGIKGSGKSLLAKAICINSNLPVIIISAPFGGDLFHSF